MFNRKYVYIYKIIKEIYICTAGGIVLAQYLKENIYRMPGEKADKSDTECSVNSDLFFTDGLGVVVESSNATE